MNIKSFYGRIGVLVYLPFCWNTAIVKGMTAGEGGVPGREVLRWQEALAIHIDGYVRDARGDIASPLSLKRAGGSVR